MTNSKKKSRESKTSSQKSDTVRSILTAIRKGRNFLIATHVNPDADTLGSGLALALGLKSLKKKVKVYNQGAIPDFLKFLPGIELVTHHFSKRSCDTIFLVDTADLKRIGEDFPQKTSGCLKIVLDHHARSRREGDLNWIDPTAASSGVVVYRLLKRLKVPMSVNIGTNIYCTLVTDTGNFQYVNTNAEAFQIAEELVRTGVKTEQIARKLYASYPLTKWKLLEKVLPTLELSGKGKIATLVLKRTFLKTTKATYDQAEDFVEYPRALQGVEVAVFFKETTKGWRISLRSKEYVDVADIAHQFGGGGHIRAAGCTISGSLVRVKKQVLKAIQRQV